MKKPDEPQHWIEKPSTIRQLWIWSGVILAVLVAVDRTYEAHPHFGVDGSFAFNAWYGFLSCILMVVGSKGIGLLLKRKDTFYDE